MRRRARYVSDCKWYMRGSCVIRQWFLPPTPRKIGQFLDAQARTNPICAWFVSDSCVIGCVTGPWTEWGVSRIQNGFHPLYWYKHRRKVFFKRYVNYRNLLALFSEGFQRCIFRKIIFLIFFLIFNNPEDKPLWFQPKDRSIQSLKSIFEYFNELQCKILTQETILARNLGTFVADAVSQYSLALTRWSWSPIYLPHYFWNPFYRSRFSCRSVCTIWWGGWQNSY
jgi:hypothetical protein